jgi:oligopeptide/dipeptide ABC transporter ATP-binding protein
VALLEVANLSVWFHTRNGVVKAVDDVSFSVDAGETLAIVGESGSGKSVCCYSLLGLVPMPPGRIEQGSAHFAGQDLLQLPPGALRALRGNRIATIFQDPMTCLNPYLTLGEHLLEPLLYHRNLTRRAARSQALALLDEVGIVDAAQRFDAYPHEFSGGMRQRVMIAMALACHPQLLIADEPTTALDVTIQAQIMALLADCKAERDMATLLITHDLGIVAQHADRVAIMYAGRIMESAPVRALFAEPTHPYTRGLLACVPKLGDKRRRLTPIEGTIPSAGQFPEGCAFLDRCPEAFAPCRGELPPLREIRPGHLVRCWGVP